MSFKIPNFGVRPAASSFEKRFEAALNESSSPRPHGLLGAVIDTVRKGAFSATDAAADALYQLPHVMTKVGGLPMPEGGLPVRPQSHAAEDLLNQVAESLKGLSEGQKDEALAAMTKQDLSAPMRVVIEELIDRRALASKSKDSVGY